MAIKVGALGDKKLFEDLLLPSWLSGLAAVTVGILLVGLTVILTKFGSTVQQSLLGLHHVYTQSPVVTKVSTISDNFANNVYLNNVLLFLLWGTVGLMVYSVVQGIWTELSRANNVVQEMHYVNAKRGVLIRDTLLRESIKVIAFVCFWLLLRYAIFNLAPLTIANAHTASVHPRNIGDWAHTLVAALLCVLIMHVLTVLARLSVLRARLFGTEIEE